MSQQRPAQPTTKNTRHGRVGSTCPWPMGTKTFLTDAETRSADREAAGRYARREVCRARAVSAWTAIAKRSEQW